MSCRAVESKLSAFVDGDLDPAAARVVTGHLEACPGCRSRLGSLRDAMEALAQLPRIAPPESIAQRVRERLEVERRGPGLALLFRPRSAARPLILPSLLPAALTVLVVLTGSVFASRNPRDSVTGQADGSATVGKVAPQGTEANPMFPSSDVALPRMRPGQVVPVQALAGMGEGSVFLETVVARDGSVFNVTLLEGNSAQAEPVLEALRHARFEPVRVKGRPVAVSVYRLISLMEVLPAPRT